MNNNRRRKLTWRLFLYLIQTTTVRMEKLEIDYEQKLHEERLYLAPPSPSLMSLFCHNLIKPFLPLRKGHAF